MGYFCLIFLSSIHPTGCSGGSCQPLLLHPFLLTASLCPTLRDKSCQSCQPDTHSYSPDSSSSWGPAEKSCSGVTAVPCAAESLLLEIDTLHTVTVTLSDEEDNKREKAILSLTPGAWTQDEEHVSTSSQLTLQALFPKLSISFSSQRLSVKQQALAISPAAHFHIEVLLVSLQTLCK